MTVECVFRKKFRCIILGIILIFWAVIMCKASAKAQETVIEAGGMVHNAEVAEKEWNANYFQRITLTLVSGQIIPETPFRENLVNNAEVIYRYKFRIDCQTSDYQVKDVYYEGVEFTGAVVGNKGISIDSRGVGYVEIDVRGARTFTVACRLRSNKIGVGSAKSNPITITPSVTATYAKSFYCTAYITALEKDYLKSKISAPGITDAVFKEDFLAAVKMNGSGRSDSNKYISYNPSTKKYFYGGPTTATGTTAVAGTTIAVDPYYIPRAKVGGVWKRATVDIEGLGLRVAEDGGSAITGYHIDVYMGTGKSTLVGWANKYRKVTLKSVR